jgi:hypothetical protein
MKLTVAFLIAAGVALASNPSPGAWVSSGFQAGGSASFTATASTGDFLVIPITTYFSPANLPSSVTVGGVAATLAVSQVNAANCAYYCSIGIYYAENVSANPTVSVTLSGSYWEGGSLNYSCGGSASNCRYDAAGTYQTGVTTAMGAATVSIATVNANSAVVAIFASSLNVSQAAGSNGTYLGGNGSGDEAYFWRSTGDVPSPGSFALNAQSIDSAGGFAYSALAISIAPPAAATGHMTDNPTVISVGPQ